LSVGWKISVPVEAVAETAPEMSGRTTRVAVANTAAEAAPSVRSGWKTRDPEEDAADAGSSATGSGRPTVAVAVAAAEAACKSIVGWKTSPAAEAPAEAA
jgi:hypothetical protein